MQHHPGPPGMMMPNLGPPMGPPRHPNAPMQPAPFVTHPGPPSMAPPPKRVHVESEDLIPEQDFISKHPVSSGVVYLDVLRPAEYSRLIK